MKKLIIVLAIVLGFGFAGSVGAETFYGVLERVDSQYRTRLTLRLHSTIERALRNMEHDDVSVFNKIYKVEVLDAKTERLRIKEQEESKPCYFIDKDGKKTEIECK